MWLFVQCYVFVVPEKHEFTKQCHLVVLWPLLKKRNHQDSTRQVFCKSVTFLLALRTVFLPSVCRVFGVLFRPKKHYNLPVLYVRAKTIKHQKCDFATICNFVVFEYVSAPSEKKTMTKIINHTLLSSSKLLYLKYIIYNQ